VTTNFFAESGVQLVSHTAFSPDLAPCDFFLFPKVKCQLKGRRFSTCEDAVAAYEDAVSDITQQEWSQAFALWFKRMRSCIQADGEYFEKL
jgi:hypothetical protein